MSYRYILFHKPFNVLCQFTPGHPASPAKETRQTLADFVPIPGVYPVGRLDYDSEGLLLLTDDGLLQHGLSNPSFAHPRTYWAQVEGDVNIQAIEALRAGVSIQGYRSRPALVQKLDGPPQVPTREPPIRYRALIPTSWLELTLTEGRNRQVRRMTAAVGFPTLRLIRIALGNLRLEGLQPGNWRRLSAQEQEALRASVSHSIEPATKKRAAKRQPRPKPR